MPLTDLDRTWIELGWKDAWRTEARGIHGEWLKSGPSSYADLNKWIEPHQPSQASGSYGTRLAPDGLPDPSSESLAIARKMVQSEGTTAAQHEAMSRVLGDNLDRIPPQMREAMARTHKVRLSPQEDIGSPTVMGVTGAWGGSWEIRIAQQVMTPKMDRETARLENKGNFVKTSGITNNLALRHTLTHEFGHALFEQAMINSGDIYVDPVSLESMARYKEQVAEQDISRGIIKDLGGPVFSGDRHPTPHQRAQFSKAIHALSGYGATAPPEAMAEAYTAYALDGKGADGSTLARKAGQDFLRQAEKNFAATDAGAGMTVSLAATADRPYTGCSGLPATVEDFDRLHGTTEAKAAAARAWGVSAEGANNISTQLELSWKDAWRTEMRGPHGEWEKDGRRPTSDELLAHIRTDHDVPNAGLARKCQYSTFLEKEHNRMHKQYGDAAHKGERTEQMHIGKLIRAAANPFVGAAPKGEEYPGQFSDRLISFWRNEPDPDAKQHLNVASADWDAGNAVGAAKHLRAAAQTSADVNDAERYRGLARDMETAGHNQAEMRTAVVAEARKAKAIVPAMLGSQHEIWNGKADIYPVSSNPEVLAEMGWDGSLSVQDRVAAAMMDARARPDQPVKNPDAFEIIEHEMIHGVVQDGSEQANKVAYQDFAMAQIEEGFTELGAIHHAPEYLDKMGIGGRESGTYPGHTVREQAVAMQDPAEIASGNAWHHYPQQSKDAQDWVQQVAKEEGVPDMRLGTPGHDRVVALTDEVNRQGAAGKTTIMARQLAVAISRDSQIRNNHAAMSDLTATIEKNIREQWKTDAPEGAAKAAFASARHTAVQRVQEKEREMQERAA